MTEQRRKLLELLENAAKTLTTEESKEIIKKLRKDRKSSPEKV